MATTNFVSGTVIQPDWLNDVDEATYNGPTGNNADITGGSIDGTIIGAIEPVAGTFTIATATSFIGDVTGDVTGNADTATTAITQSAGDSSTKIATTAFVTAADNLKAPLASPVFTGTVTVPDASFAPSKLTQPLTLGTAVATTSGTFIDFTSTPSWVKRITVMLSGVSVSGTSNTMLQIGDSGGIEATGYLGAATYSGGGGVTTNFTTGFGISTNTTATNIQHGVIQLILMNSSTNLWVSSGNVAFSDATNVSSSAGSKPLSGTLDRIRLTTVNGADTFDAGSVNIMYE